MRKVTLIAVVLILFGLVIAFYPSYVEEPVKMAPVHWPSGWTQV